MSRAGGVVLVAACGAPGAPAAPTNRAPDSRVTAGEAYAALFGAKAVAFRSR